MFLSRRLLSRSSNWAIRNASSLVVAEHEGGKVSAGTLSTLNAAASLKGEISVLVVGKDVAAVAKDAAKVNNVSKVLVLDNPVFENVLAEDMAKVVQQLATKYTHILSPATNHSKNFMPRAAVKLDSSPLSDVIAVVDEQTFRRPVYAGNAISTVKMNAANKFLLIRTTAFEKAGYGTNEAPIENLSLEVTKDAASSFVSANVSKSDRPDLTAARVVVAGGRAMKNSENFEILFKLADKLNGAVGASRAAVDAGYISNEYQIGQTGKVIAPELYIGCGISGAIQHISGMKDSKVIVVINKDKEAPFFQLADYGLVDDLFKAVPDMTSKL